MTAECTVSILQHSALAPSTSRRREVTRVVCVNICILRDFHAAIINLHTEASLSLTKYPTLTSHQTAPPTSPLIPHTSHLTPHTSHQHLHWQWHSQTNKPAVLRDKRRFIWNISLKYLWISNKFLVDQLRLTFLRLYLNLIKVSAGQECSWWIWKDRADHTDHVTLLISPIVRAI